MKDAELVLLQGSYFDVLKILPVVLEHIKDIAMTCKESSKGVAKQFEYSMNVIPELEQSFVQTKSFSQKEIKRLQLEIIQQKQKQGQLEENKQQL